MKRYHSSRSKFPICVNLQQGKINDALAALQSGTSFAEVAKEFSEDKASQGGNLGWMTRQAMWYVSRHLYFVSLFFSGEFQTRAFSAPLNQYTQPFKTQHGYVFIGFFFQLIFWHYE